MRRARLSLLVIPTVLVFFACSTTNPDGDEGESGVGGSGTSPAGGSGPLGAGDGGTGPTGGTSASSGGVNSGVGGVAGPNSGGAAAVGGGPGAGGSAGPGSGGAAPGSGGGPSNTGDGFYQLESLDRGVVAVADGDGVYVGWRLLGYDDENVTFNVYRDGTLVNPAPLTDSTNYFDADGESGSEYSVTALVGGAEAAPSAPVSVWGQGYLEIPVALPAGAYSPNDASVGDLDGDGDYEIIVKIYPDNAQDNANSGVTDNTYLDAYDSTGARLWRIDLGRNIRSGAHYSPFLVYDFDGDGRAELMVKTAEGTVDGEGNNVLMPGDDAAADHRNSGGYVLEGPEYLTVFDGLTGAEVDSVAYDPPRGNVNSWGDDYGNRVDRFLGAVILGEDGAPLAMFSRGYYTRTVLAAWKLDQGALSLAWIGDSENEGNLETGQGAHSLSVANVDDDPAQEIIFGAMTVDHDGSLKCTTGFGHGDALHVSAFIPGYGQVAMLPHESDSSLEATMRDAGTCEILWRGSNNNGDEGPGRAVCADIDPGSPGAECWWGSGTISATESVGAQNTGALSTVGTSTSSSNFVISWDADLARELLDSNSISNPDGNGPGLTASGCSSSNGTKSTPNLTADIVGDWREEVIFRCGSSLRIYTTTDVAENRMYTLMHDPQYRMAVAWQNGGYNQPPHTSFFMGAGMEPAPRPDMHTP